MIRDGFCKVHGLLDDEDISISKRHNRKSLRYQCRKCMREYQADFREKAKVKFKDFNGECKAPGCESAVKYAAYMLCGVHRYRWEKYKSYDAPAPNKLPDGIVIKCKIHGFLTVDETHTSEGFYRCKQCKKDAGKKYKRCQRKTKHHWLMRNFGITIDEYELMLSKQNGVCAICLNNETAKQTHAVEKTRSLSVDHCHSTMKIRGLLCGRCNNMIGYAKDNPAILRAGADYLEL